MTEPQTNYFVCTLGEAAQPSISRPFTDVNQLLEKQAAEHPDLPAIGFYLPTQNDAAGLGTKLLTFRAVHERTTTVAVTLGKLVDLPRGQIVGLLAASSPEFLFTWLACIRLGYPVLLIAPQCSASAIAHLCRVCDVSVLLVDEKYENLAKRACEAADQLKHILLPFAKSGIETVFDSSSEDSQQVTETSSQVKPDDIAYLHHTSGTSSGMPKPIPQTHHGAVGVLPALDGTKQATFTTTPLYHGGPADIFRAWTSNAMIWLFPSKEIPITASNICRCLEVAQVFGNQNQQPSIKYFTSVPYILQMMAADKQGLTWLQNMDLVGVGGAALPVEVGDQLVRDRVNLVSRFGAAECGFLLSSSRDYSKDKEWQYLRQSSKVDLFHFEAREGDLYELVIGPNWPHMAKRNREDGSYATSDLFAKHPSISNAWRYHSRADSQLTLITGKKFDPAPLEDAIVASSDLVSDVLIFGNGQPYPGALVFRSKPAESTIDSDLIDKVALIIEAQNKENQSHAKIPLNMIFPMPYDEKSLDKSSKGTILRSKAEERYADNIEQAYNNVQTIREDVPDDQISHAISELVSAVMGQEKASDLETASDLFAHGVDSVACVQIRHGLVPLVPKGTDLPLTVVEDCRTIAGLSDFVVGLRHGDTTSSSIDQRKDIPDLVEQYTRLDTARPIEEMIDDWTTVVEPPGKTVLLTGPTGSLGSHVLSQLLQAQHIAHIYLLIRGATPQAARERVLKALSSRKLQTDNFDAKVTILQCKLSEPDLGISFMDYSALQSDVDIVLHLAWSVNFLLSLGSFAPHFAAIQNLLNLCLSSTQRKPPRLVFCSSVASVSNFSPTDATSANIPETLATNTSASGSTGYALSKLTAELILARAATKVSSLRDRITIVRVGQLSADTTHGVWSKSEAYPQILASSKITNGLLPDLGREEKLTWLPVDVTAKAFVEASFVKPELIGDMPTEHVRHEFGKKYDARSMLGGSQQEIDGGAVKVLHLLNPIVEHTFTEFVLKLKNSQDQSPGDLQIGTAQQWLEKLEQVQQQSRENANSEISSQAQSLLRLLPFWKQAYSKRKPIVLSSEKDTKQENIGEDDQADLLFDMHNSLIAMPTLAYWLGLSTVEGRAAQSNAKSDFDGDGSRGKEDALPPSYEPYGLLTSEYVQKVWAWVRENVP